MSTVEERFETVTKNVSNIMELAQDLGTLGIYGEAEQAALTILMVTLDKAMKLLDPDGAQTFIKEALKKKAPHVTLEDVQRMLSEMPNSRQAGPYL